MYSYILKKEFNGRYIDSFNKYAIDIIYGDNILIGSDLVKDYEDDEV